MGQVRAWASQDLAPKEVWRCSVVEAPAHELASFGKLRRWDPKERLDLAQPRPVANGCRPGWEPKVAQPAIPRVGLARCHGRQAEGDSFSPTWRFCREPQRAGSAHPEPRVGLYAWMLRLWAQRGKAWRGRGAWFGAGGAGSAAGRRRWFGWLLAAWFGRIRPRVGPSELLPSFSCRYMLANKEHLQLVPMNR